MTAPPTHNVMTPKSAGDSFRHVVGPDTSVVKTGGGVLRRIVINAAVASGVITVYNNTAGSGAVIAIITHPATLLNSQMVLEYDAAFSIGLTVVQSGADDITVIYR